jgi:DNA modification methylase
MRLEDLDPAPYNPRTISKESMQGLSESLRRFGLVQPIVWNKRSKQIIGGHQRREALMDHGAEEADVVVVDLDENDERALNITLNNPAVAGEFTDELQSLLVDLKEQMPEPFEDLRLDELLKDLAGSGEVIEDEAPPPPKIAVSKPGDLIQMGDHLLLCGDSCVTTDIERLMKAAGAQADMVFTDPPYGVKFGEANHNPRAKRWDAIANDEKQGESLYDFSSHWVASILIAAKESAPLYCWSASMDSGYEIVKALRDGGIHVQSQIIWVKNVLVLGQADYQWKHEICWYGWKEGKHHYWAGGRTLTTVWEFSKDANSAYVHPMQKPVALSANAIHNSCPAGGTVLDLFAGSGSTLMGCEQSKRRFIGLELDPRYCDVIIQRWETSTRKKAKRLPKSK